MLTRLEVDGFKNLVDLTVEFGPFTCIAGANGVGKSNLFDAIRFLSLLADHSLMEAARLVRGTAGRPGEPRGLFWTDGNVRASRMRFAVEMIVPRVVRDEFEREAKATSTFLRYELELGYEEPTGLATLGRLVLLREELRHITKGDAWRHLSFPHRARAFRDEVVDSGRRGGPFISTREEEGTPTIRIHGDGGSRGPGRPSPALSAPRTIVGTVTQYTEPTILAAKRELQSWRLLALEPAAMRGPDRFTDPPRMDASGAYLARTLYRLASTPDPESGEADSEAVFSDVASSLSDLIPVRAVSIDRDDRRELLTLQLAQPGGPLLPARSLSDGTLRFLALCLMELDPETRGLICMEEPENGIHPARMRAMVELVMRLAVDPEDAPGDSNPMRQVIINTHSPGLVQVVFELAKDSLLFASAATVRKDDGIRTGVLRLRPMRGTWRAGDQERGVTPQHVTNYLSVLPGEQVAFVAEPGRS
ncbi:MAG: AAA family ATPase [Alphaproteobacteria bacterium]|nr:AAA family ATPase [Alphaproteobacteria bacterium]